MESPSRNGMTRPWLVGLVVAAVIALATAAWLLRPDQSTAEKIEPPKNDFDPWTSRSLDDYVGSQACRECHAEIADRYASHPMYHSTRPMSESTIAIKQGQFSSGPGINYQIEPVNGRAKHTEIAIDVDGKPIYEQSVEVSHVIGGVRAQTFLHERNGKLFESPVTWYEGAQKWDLSPGYRHMYNERFDRPIADRCLVCHVGRMNYVEPPKGPHVAYGQPLILEAAIGCERCHGPGREHIAFQRGERDDDRMLRISELAPAKRDAICNQCHLTGDAQFLRQGRQHSDFRPGDSMGDIWTTFVKKQDGEKFNLKAVSQVEQMHTSKCFQMSEGRLGCITCHDPHFQHKADQHAEFYNNRCLKCHEVDGCEEQPNVRKAAPAKGSCIHCHMPKSPSNIPHTSQTNHQILRRDEQASSDGLTETHPAQVSRLKIFNDTQSPLPPLVKQRADGLLAGQLGNEYDIRTLAVKAEQDLRPVAKAAPTDVEVIFWLGMSVLKQDRLDEAMVAWRKAHELNPDHIGALFSLAQGSEAQEDPETAEKHWNRLVELQPWKAHWRARKARLLFAVGGRTKDATEAAVQALRLDPNHAPAYDIALPGLRRLGRFEEAREFEDQRRRILEGLERAKVGPNAKKSNLPPSR